MDINNNEEVIKLIQELELDNGEELISEIKVNGLSGETKNKVMQIIDQAIVENTKLLENAKELKAMLDSTLEEFDKIDQEDVDSINKKADEMEDKVQQLATQAHEQTKDEDLQQVRDNIQAAE